MRILHTSDWHLGARLYEQSREEEHENFLRWLTRTIATERIDALLVAGDIFDNGTPANSVTRLYYNFLKSLLGTCCRHIIITGGNHDSPSFLNAPAEALTVLNTRVVGCVNGRLEDEVIVLDNADGTPECVVCAVPYLRDGDVRTATFGEDPRDRDQKLREGVRRHYEGVIDIARRRAEALAGDGRGSLPVIAMGHLFAHDSRKNDGERDIIVGTLGEIDISSFVEGIDYLALGHLHNPQMVGGNDRARYCGSALRMTFGPRDSEAKKVFIVSCEAGAPGEKPSCSIESRDIPVFRELLALEGGDSELKEALAEAVSHPRAFIEVRYTGERSGRQLRADLVKILEEACPEEALRPRILRLKMPMSQSASWDVEDSVRLEDLSVTEVFERRLAQKSDLTPEDLEMFRGMFQEILAHIDETPEDAAEVAVADGNRKRRETDASMTHEVEE